MSAQHPVYGIDMCPGGAEYGRGMTLTTVHVGGCCQQWEADHPVYGPERAAEAELEAGG